MMYSSTWHNQHTSIIRDTRLSHANIRTTPMIMTSSVRIFLISSNKILSISFFAWFVEKKSSTRTTYPGKHLPQSEGSLEHLRRFSRKIFAQLKHGAHMELKQNIFNGQLRSVSQAESVCRREKMLWFSIKIQYLSRKMDEKLYSYVQQFPPSVKERRTRVT